MHEAVIPPIEEDDEHYKKNIYGKLIPFDTQEKFHTYEEESSVNETNAKLCNISIQAAPILHDFSKVSFQDDSLSYNFDVVKGKTKKHHRDEGTGENTEYGEYKEYGESSENG